MNALRIIRLLDSSVVSTLDQMDMFKQKLCNMFQDIISKLEIEAIH